jgi:hypothetical protein
MFGVDVVSISATASTVTVGVIVGWDIVAGVKGGGHGVLVAFEGVVLRTEAAVHVNANAVDITSCGKCFEMLN